MIAQAALPDCVLPSENSLSGRKPAVDRRFWTVFGLSIALHTLALAWTLGAASRPPADLPAIVATLRQIAAAPSGSTTAPEPAAILQEVRPKATPAERQPAPRAPQLAKPVRMPAPVSTPAPVAAMAPTQISTPLEPVASAPAAAPEAPPVAPPAKPQSEVLAGYRQRLAELFAAHHEYPRVAALRGWEGEVRLRLKVARKGNLVLVQLDRSSGFDVLDQHAMAMLAGLGGLPPLPEALEASEIQIVVPINYKLKKTT